MNNKPDGTLRIIYNGQGKRHCITIPLVSNATIDYDYFTQEITVKARGRYLADPWAFDTVKWSKEGEQ